MSFTTPEVGLYRENSIQEGITKLYGSWQGNGSLVPNTALLRGGHFFTPTRVSAGLYKVALINPPTIAQGGTATNGIGLHVEPKAWITSESETDATAPAVITLVQTSRVVLSNNFWIWVYSITTGGSPAVALYDVTTADRINFELGWKATGFAP